MTDIQPMQTNDIILEETKCKMGRPKVYEEGYKEHYKTIKYMLNYYHAHKELTECTICKKMTNRSHIREHQKSKKCRKCIIPIVD
jgi:hypothetical protein